MDKKDTILDRYEIASEIDRGPHAVVHRARDCQADRDVMLKTIELSDELSPETKEAFRIRVLSEAGRTEGFSHPGVVAVYDVDESPDGEATHISMEYVPGPHLDDVIAAEGSLRPDWAFSMAENLADALQSAHQAGVCLPSLEPAEIVIHETEGVAKIAEAGVAYVAASDPEQPRMVHETTAYMAPECVEGQEPDLRSDLYSLSAILYETLCGRHPFRDEDGYGKPLTPISGQAPDLSPELDGFFEQALAEDPDDRFQNASELRKALHNVRREQHLFVKRGDTEPVAPPFEPETFGELDLGPAPSVELEVIAEPEMPAEPEMLAEPEMSAEPDVVAEPEQVAQPGLTDDPIELERLAPAPVPAPAPDKPRAKVVAPVDRPRQTRDDGPETNTGRTKAAVAIAVIVLLLMMVLGWKFFGGNTTESVPPDAALSAAESQPVAPMLKVLEPDELATVDPVNAEPAPVEPPPKIEKPVAAKPKKKPTPKKVASKPKVAPPEPAPVVVAAVAPATIEPEPVVPAAPAKAEVKMFVKSSIKSGSLVVWVDGNRVHTSELASGAKRFARLAKKAVGKGQQTLEASFELDPGSHQIDVQVNTAKGKRYEKTVTVDLEAGAQQSLNIVAGKAIGSRLTVSLD